MAGLDAPRGFVLIGRFVVRMYELHEFCWPHPATDPAQHFGMTPYRLLSIGSGLTFRPEVYPCAFVSIVTKKL